MRLLIALCLLVVPFSAANAQNSFDLTELRDGETLLNISATETRQVPQDLLVAILQYSAEGLDKRTLQNEVNTNIKTALDEIKKVEAVKYATQGYRIYEFTLPATVPNVTQPDRRMWRAQQSIEVKSKDAAALLDLVGKLQDSKLDLQDLSYTLSPELFEQTTNELVTDALKKLQVRADQAAKTLGKSGVTFVEVNVQGNGYARPQMMRSYAMADSMEMAKGMAAPSAEAGESDVSLTVDTRALLKP
jgi:predicted secreted protein